jgi:hypothetical protein
MPLEDILSNLPKGKRLGGATVDPAGAKLRKLAVATKVLAASLSNQVLYQKADLSQLPEYLCMKTRNGLGDFLGGGRAGLSLDREQSGKDVLIRPSPLQAARVWKWLKKYAEEAIPKILDANGFPSVEALEERIKRDLTNHQSSGKSTDQPA